MIVVKRLINQFFTNKKTFMCFLILLLSWTVVSSTELRDYSTLSGLYYFRSNLIHRQISNLTHRPERIIVFFGTGNETKQVSTMRYYDDYEPDTDISNEYDPNPAMVRGSSSQPTSLAFFVYILSVSMIVKIVSTY